ncbi:nucleoside triphosphatase YtkD [Neobacillus notoginsengisoli]|uniref:Nucleoside triphosphatase YtkD n=1 Tax=Neobacillus notoginsengisoli TaxID=1578198 RepID=A0A417YUG8_9BACI|nr:nucleoside triphosphatase YtkD [Neobacillus notoginsengisoli]RHW40831.1 nucleoside triphosphatase YtkD [Neobacillus notoginsengisoli]
MKEFKDLNGYNVELSFSKGAFKEKAVHVLVICLYDGKWLLTRHKERGLEFPGGKVEQGETLEQAAAREVNEETGAVVQNLEWLAEYRVMVPEGPFVKAVFVADVKSMENQKTYYETEGPQIIEGSLETKRLGEAFSFIMKDDVVGECLKQIEEDKRI